MVASAARTHITNTVSRCPNPPRSSHPPRNLQAHPPPGDRDKCACASGSDSDGLSPRKRGPSGLSGRRAFGASHFRGARPSASPERPRAPRKTRRGASPLTS